MARSTLNKKKAPKKEPNHSVPQGRQIAKANKARWQRIKRTYGLTQAQYEQMLEEQNGACFICRRTVQQIRRSRSKYLTIDHCHQTGTIRGLLCSDCNGRILPAIKEDAGVAFRMFEYLYRDRGYGTVPERTQEIDKQKKENRYSGRKRNIERETEDAR